MNTKNDFLNYQLQFDFMSKDSCKDRLLKAASDSIQAYYRSIGEYEFASDEEHCERVALVVFNTKLTNF